MIESEKRKSTPTVDWPGWKRALHFDQCYAVILMAVVQCKFGVLYIYRDWIETRLGSPYDRMIAWAEENGWPSVESVWQFGWR